jgi:hypothetical protein
MIRKYLGQETIMEKRHRLNEFNIMCGAELVPHKKVRARSLARNWFGFKLIWFKLIWFELIWLGN